MNKFNLAVGGLLLFVLGSTFAMADEAKASGGLAPRIGFEAGFNSASLKGKNTSAVFESRLGFVGGGFLSLPLGPSLAFQPEVLFAQKGGKINGNDYRLDYVEIPLLVDVTLFSPLGILLGPSFDFNVASENVSNLRKTDVGLVLGTQVRLSNIHVGARYTVGLTELNTDAQIKSGTFTFLVGLSLI